MLADLMSQLLSGCDVRASVHIFEHWLSGFIARTRRQENLRGHFLMLDELCGCHFKGEKEKKAALKYILKEMPSASVD